MSLGQGEIQPYGLLGLIQRRDTVLALLRGESLGHQPVDLVAVEVPILAIGILGAQAGEVDLLAGLGAVNEVRVSGLVLAALIGQRCLLGVAEGAAAFGMAVARIVEPGNIEMIGGELAGTGRAVDIEGGIAVVIDLAVQRLHIAGVAVLSLQDAVNDDQGQHRSVVAFALSRDVGQPLAVERCRKSGPGQNGQQHGDNGQDAHSHSPELMDGGGHGGQHGVAGKAAGGKGTDIEIECDGFGGVLHRNPVHPVVIMAVAAAHIDLAGF